MYKLKTKSSVPLLGNLWLDFYMDIFMATVGILLAGSFPWNDVSVHSGCRFKWQNYGILFVCFFFFSFQKRVHHTNPYIVCLCGRRLIDLCLRVCMRAMWFCGGFHWIKVKGERAAPSEVPILTVAPHSSYFDAIPVTMTMCSIVTKLESRSIPVWGSEYALYISVDIYWQLTTILNIKKWISS